MPSPLSKTEVKKLRHYAQEGKHGLRNAALIEVMLSGCRCKEACSVSVGEAIDANGLVKKKFYLAAHKTKSGKGRWVFLTSQAQETIQYYYDAERSEFSNKDKDLPLFRSQKDPHKPLVSTTGQAIVKACFRKAAIDGGSHRCRATFISTLADQKGIKNFHLMTAAGHQNLSSTQRYLNFNTRPIEDVMDDLKL